MIMRWSIRAMAAEVEIIVCFEEWERGGESQSSVGGEVGGNQKKPTL